MTNYPQRPNMEPARSATSSPLDDPGMRMILSMSPQDGSLRPLPSDLRVQESQDGTLNVTYPDGSVRQLIPGAEGEGRMITTLADGTRIQSDLTFGEGQVSISSISSTGEKTLLSLNENGANMQRVTPDGQVFSFIPDSAPELIESFREVEAFAQAEELRELEQFEDNQQFGEWNNYGKPADWQPEQNWQPPATFMPPHPQNFGPQFGGEQGIIDTNGYPQPMPFIPPQNFGADNFGRPDYAGNNWVDNGNGSWIAPVQPDTFQQPQQYGEWNNYGKPADWQPQPNWQPPANFMPPQPQNFGPQFGGAQGIIDTNGYPQPMPYMPPQNFGGDNFGRPDYAGNNWVDNGNGSWIAPVQPDAFQQPQQFGEWNNFGKPADWQPQPNWQPPATFMPPQNFDSGFQPGFQGGYLQPMPFVAAQPHDFGPPFGGAQGIIDTNGYPQPMPMIANNASVPLGGYVDVMAYSRQAPLPDANGFMRSVQTDSSGFPYASHSQAPSYDGASPVVEIVTSFDDVPQDPSNDLEQAPQQ